LLLGGDPTDAPDVTYRLWDNALRAPGVRGLIVGRALLYPPDGDVTAAVDTAATLVHAPSTRTAMNQNGMDQNGPTTGVPHENH
jgi:hypothetical protein